MSGPDLIHDGWMPTPYGQQIKVFRRPDLPPGDDAALVFSVESAAMLAGIYDPAERKRFTAETARQTKLGSGGVRLRFEDFGGHVVPKVPLPWPADPLYPRMPAKEMTSVEEWSTAMMDRANWHERAAFFDVIFAENMAEYAHATGDLAEAYPATFSLMLTAALEHLAEKEIDCLEAAAFYAVSMHREWADAGQAWLHPFRATWLRDWLAARPGFTTFARRLRPTLDLPEWLGAP